MDAQSAIWAAGASLALTAGPFVGGALITLVGWRSIFLVNLPIGLAGLWLAWRYAGETTRLARREIDLPGQILAVLTLGTLAGALIEGGEIGWSHLLVMAGFMTAVLAGLLFVWREGRATQPMLPLSLFARRMFALTALVGLLVNVSIYGLIFVFSLYFQRINGLSPFAAGLAFVPMLGAVLPVNLLAPRLAERIGARAHHRARRRHFRRRLHCAVGNCAGHALLGAVLAADRHQQRAWFAGAAFDLDPAWQRGEIALRHRGRCPQRDTADRQRARRRAVRVTDRAIKRLHGRRACFADDFGWRSARGRGGDLVWRRQGRAIVMHGPVDCSPAVALWCLLTASECQIRRTRRRHHHVVHAR